MVYDENTYVNEAIFLGIVEETDAQGRARIMQRNKFSVGEEIQIMKPDGRDIPVTVTSMINGEGEPVESAPHPKETIWLDLHGLAETGDLLRIVRAE